MKQNNISQEIFLLLEREPKHQRELARELNINQTTIRRKLKQLQNENTIDYKIKGKNQTYFIKDTLESELYKEKLEYYKLQKILKIPKIRRIIKEIKDFIYKKELDSNLIIVLFGSYAKGIATKESDIDIYINSNNKKIKEKIQAISKKINIKFGELNKKNELSEEIIKNHIILNNIQGFCNLIKW